MQHLRNFSHHTNPVYVTSSLNPSSRRRDLPSTSRSQNSIFQKPFQTTPSNYPREHLPSINSPQPLLESVHNTAISAHFSTKIRKKRRNPPESMHISRIHAHIQKQPQSQTRPGHSLASRNPQRATGEPIPPRRLQASPQASRRRADPKRAPKASPRAPASAAGSGIEQLRDS